MATRENAADRKKRANALYGALAKAYPDAKCSLDYATPWQLLVAVMFSAQNLDATVNVVTKGLFAKFPDARSMAAAKEETLWPFTKQLNYWKTKTRHAVAAARMIMESYGGEMPTTMTKLVSLPGIGRKSANVYLGEIHGGTEGVVVDTHVIRIAGRLGLTKEKDPKKIELDLLKLLDGDRRRLFSHLLVYHGRALCKSRKPDCANCPVRKMCPFFSKEILRRP